MDVTFEEARRAVHEALAGLLDDDELAVSWVLTIDVAGTNGVRYLAHRAGGGHDGSEGPASWVAAGMLQASADLARHQTLNQTVPAPEDDDEPEGEPPDEPAV